MFSIVHKHKRLLLVALLLFIVPPFAFFGLESYTSALGGGDEVAMVEGNPISEREFTEELARQQDRMRSMFGRNIDPALLDTPEMRKGMLDSMVAQRVLAAEAIKSNLIVDDEMLRNTIASMPAFQVDGKFSRSAYESVLRAQGMTPAAYQERLRYDMSLGQLTRAVGESAFTARSVAERVAALEGQQREVAEARIQTDSFTAGVKIDAAQVKAYYEANPAEFRTPERVKAQYLVLSAGDLAARDPVSEADIKAAYQARIAKDVGTEQRRVSHILIPYTTESKDAEKQAARKQAEQVLAELRKSPTRFAELARKHSQDPGSSDKGGDLGFFSRGAMVKSFEDVAFTLKEGETSALVETEFGFHIIRVVAIQAAKPPTLEALRKELSTELQAQKGSRAFNAAAADFSNTVYEQSDSLEPAAQKYKLQLQTSGWIENAPGETAGPLGNPRLRAALFATDAIQGRRNTDAMEVAPSTLASARVMEYQPAAQRKLEEVSAEIEKRLRQREAAKLAEKEGAARLESLRKGESVSLNWSPTRLVSRRNPAGLAPQALAGISAADASTLPAYVGVAVGESGYAIYRVSKVLDAPAKNEQQKGAELQQVQRLAGANQFEAYLAALRERSKVTINKERLEKKQQP